MSAGDFLYSFGNMIASQFGVGTNQNSVLATDQGQYGKLGTFANQFDQSARRSYTEEGASFTDPYNPTPKQLDQLMQTPDINVFIKKRAFASLAENYRPDLMDQQEILFYNATKILFANKCKQISNFEQLAKISQISQSVGQLSTYLLPTIFSIADNMASLPPLISVTANQSLSTFQNIIDQVRNIVALSKNNRYTTWVTAPSYNFASTLGLGTGVIELTNVAGLSTTTTLKFGEGNFTLDISDPYELMLITNNDIETALYNATNPTQSNSFTQLGLSAIEDAIDLDQQELTAARTSRGVNAIAFSVQPTIIPGGQQIFAVVNNVGLQILFTGGLFGATIDPSALIGSPQFGNNGLTPNEASIFSNIISSMFNQIALIKVSQLQTVTYNQAPQITAVRKRLRLHYASKLIIQPMDNVHIYISSKKTIDNNIVGGLQTSFGGPGFAQMANSLSYGLEDSFNVTQPYSLEKEVYVGANFPDWLWLAMRSQFVADQNGAHVFAGVVKEARSSYNDGKFSVSVNGNDNADYFNYGIINFKPSLQVYNGTLYDPLTPFDIQFDSTTGVQTNSTPPLLPENIGMFSSVFIKNKNGPLAGTIPTEASFNMPDSERTQNIGNRRVFYDPEGLVYRWKEGIGSVVGFGDSQSPNPIDGGVPALTDNPFAGQGIMNTLSLLICGEPYNFATYYKSAINAGALIRDPASGEDAAPSYFKSLRAALKARNAIYGNFIPFKILTMDDATYSKILSGQLTISSYDSELNDLLKQRASLADKLVYLSGSKLSSGTPPPGAGVIAEQLKELDKKIGLKTNQINTSLTTQKPISIIGDDISYDPSALNTGSSTSIDSNLRDELRQKLNFLTRRLIWKVRGNEDTNYLIVDDTYDKDSDVQAFETSFINPQLLDSKYTSPAQQIKDTAKLLELEVFSNTQGHIEVRNPRYNRMPSSVFYKMLNMSNQFGIKVFPQFLEDLYATQLNGLFQNIETVENEIRLYCLALGFNTDGTCLTFINGGGGGANTINMAGGTGLFSFLSDESTGKIGTNLDFTTLSAMANPDQLLSTVQTELNKFAPQTTASAFNIAVRANIIQSNVVVPSSSNNPTQFSNLSAIQNNATSITRMTKFINILNLSTGTMFPFSQIFGNTNPSASIISSTDVLQITNEIATRLANRQTDVKLAVNALTNVQEGSSISQDGTGSNTTSSPSLYGSNQMPQALQFMIEDETYDDYGPGSAQRFTIKNHDIISYNIYETKPEYTTVEVNGRMGTQDFILPHSALPHDLNIGQAGNALITSTAVDYDLWRQYGITVPARIEAPFLNNPDTQCAPYAVSLLNRMKSSVIKGSIDIVGNEYQQPGEVIYIENRDYLFYVESVKHDFTYGERFTTSMALSYGHNAGEYIPTPYDVIGKVLYRTKDITTLTHKRQGNVFNQEHVGTIVGKTNTLSIVSTTAAGNDITSGPYSDANTKTLAKIISSASTSLAAATDTYSPMLEIRIYYDSAVGTYGSPASYATQLQSAVLAALSGSSLSGNIKPATDTSTNNQSLSAYANQIKTVAVDSNPNIVGEFRYPSNSAYYYARDAVAKTASNLAGNQLQQNIDNVIYNSIVDCWIVFQNPNPSSSTPTS